MKQPVKMILILGFLVFIAIITLGYSLRLQWVGVATSRPESLKTLWDWMELLIFPGALGVGVWWLTTAEQRRRQSEIEAQRQMEIDAAIRITSAGSSPRLSRCNDESDPRGGNEALGGGI